MFILLRSFYIACLNNDMFWPFHRPLSGRSLSLIRYLYSIQCYAFVVEILRTSIKFPFKMITIVVELKVIMI